MRILSSVTDPRLGGPQRRSLDVARRLSERGIEVVFLIPEGDDSFADTAREAGFETWRIDMPRIRSPTRVRANLRFLGTFPSVVRSLTRRLSDSDVDAVHANMSVNFTTAAAAAQSGTPLAWHFNDTLTPTPVKQIAARLGRRWADEIVVAADAVHDYYFGEGVRSRTIYAPVDIEAFDPDTIEADEDALREELGVGPSIPIVGTVGNLNPIKGHEYLLRAVAELREDGTEVAVPIVGELLESRSQYVTRLRELRSELGLTDTVHFLGFRSDIAQLLQLFDVFVLPSTAEACPIVILEAMAAECPVVATRVGGVPEQLPNQEYGWVVPPENPSALADALRDALRAPERRRECTQNARERVRSMFSLDACTDRHVELYESLTR